MSLLNSLFTGVSGLRNHQSMMDVIGDNISNVNTIGFKSSRVTFADTFNEYIKSGTNPSSDNSAGGTNTLQIGLGSKINSIDRNWSQGTFEQTSTNTDLALKGDGLFILKSNGTDYYSRAGAFEFDSDGNLVNSSDGAIVQGKVANGMGVIPSGTTLQNITIDKNLRLPATKTSNTAWSGNLQSSSTTIRTDTVAISGNVKNGTAATDVAYPGTGYNAADPTTYNVSNIYGKDGTEYQLRSYYTKANGTDNWTYHYDLRNMDGTSLSTPYTGSQALTFNATTGACTNSTITVDDSAANINYKLNFSSLSNLDADTSTVDTIDAGAVASDVIGSQTIYDSLGNAHTLTVTYKHLDSNKWSWAASVASEDGTLSPDAQGIINFDTSGQIASVWQNGTQITSTPAEPAIVFTPSNGSDTQTMKLNFGSNTSGITQTSLSSTVSALSQDGSASATLSSTNIDQYGNISGIFTNGQSKTLAQIMVATFANVNGLTSAGDNMYSVSANSGDPLVNAPGELSNTTIESGALEQSNVDLSSEFTNMIVSQRGFQANARVITTADTLLQEITNLIR